MGGGKKAEVSVPKKINSEIIFFKSLPIHSPLVGTADRVHIINKTHKRIGCIIGKICLI